MTQVVIDAQALRDYELRIAALENTAMRSDATIAMLARVTAALSNEVGHTSALLNLVSASTGANAMAASLTAEEIKPIDLNSEDILNQLASLQEIDPLTIVPPVKLQLDLSQSELAAAYITLARVVASCHRALTDALLASNQDSLAVDEEVVEYVAESLRGTLDHAQTMLANIAMSGVLTLSPESDLASAVDEIATEFEAESSGDADDEDEDDLSAFEDAVQDSK